MKSGGIINHILPMFVQVGIIDYTGGNNDYIDLVLDTWSTLN